MIVCEDCFFLVFVIDTSYGLPRTESKEQLETEERPARH